MKRPLLSIAIPTFQRFPLLQRALGSALGELKALGSAVEVLVLDNGSEDGSREWLRSLPKRPGLKVRLQAKNLGMVGNWNSAVRLARGTWLNILHDDDALLPGFAAAALEAHAASPGLAFSFGAFKVLRQEGLEGRVHRPLGEGPRLLRTELAFSWILAEFCPITAATVVFDRGRLLSAGGFRPKAALAADGDAYLRLAAQAPVLYRAGVHAGFGFHGGNLQLGMSDERTARLIGRILGQATIPWPLGPHARSVGRFLADVALERQAVLNGLAAYAQGRADQGALQAERAGGIAHRLDHRLWALPPAGLRRRALRWARFLPRPFKAPAVRASSALERLSASFRPSPDECLVWLRAQTARPRREDA